jgi:PhoH-like ATPase
MPLPNAPKTKGDILSADQYGSRRTKKQPRKAAPAAADPASRLIEIAPDPKPAKAARKTPARAAKPAARPQPKKAAAPVSVPLQTEKPHETMQVPAVSQASRLRGPRGLATTAKPRMFVLDTNVLLHDPMCLFRFAEHDVFLPMTTLEELDNHKKGLSDLARNARQVSRSIDQLLAASTSKIVDGIPLDAIGNSEAQGSLFMQTTSLTAELPSTLPIGKADNMILATVKALQEQHPDMSIVLVSKDINMRIKATALGLSAEDYFNDKTLDDTDMLYSGCTRLPSDFWEVTGKTLESWQADGRTWYRIQAPFVLDLFVNEFVATENNEFVAQVKSIEGSSATLATVRDYMQPKNAVWGIHARNLEQSLALNLLLDKEIDFVTLLGQAGTGKTLLTLAAALAQTLDERAFSEIIFTRATVSVGEDIGYLPGTEEEKMEPWMGALEDNLEVLNKADRSSGEWGRSAAADLIHSRIRVKSMSFMRGRTFLNKLVIIDEAQNLSPKQMKTLITRAGPGTKIVCLGNIAQIDTPYLTEGSSGLTYVVDRFKGWKHSGHITLQRGERSRLADHATDVL